MQRRERSSLPEVRPKVGPDGIGIPPQQKPEDHQSQQRRRFCRGEHILDQSPQPYSEHINKGQQNHHGNTGEVCGIHPYIHIPQQHRTHPPRRYVADMPQPVRRRNARKENAKEFAKSYSDSRNGARLDHQEQGPPIQKAPHRPQRLAQIYILSARPGHHRREFPVAQSADHRHRRGYQPRGNQQSGRSYVPADIGRHDEDTRADHRSNNNGGGAEETESLHQVRARRGRRLLCGGAADGHFSLFYRKTMPCAIWLSVRYFVAYEISVTGNQNREKFVLHN